jgi:hypothetical protein
MADNDDVSFVRAPSFLTRSRRRVTYDMKFQSVLFGLYVLASFHILPVLSCGMNISPFVNNPKPPAAFDILIFITFHNLTPALYPTSATSS